MTAARIEGTGLDIFRSKDGAWRAGLATVALVAAGGSAVAQAAGPVLQCRFDVECLAPDGCSDTDFAAELSINADLAEGTPDARLTSVSETVDLTLYANVFGDVTGASATFAGQGKGAFHTLAREPDGAAVYTVTMESGPMVVTYLGRCEAGE